MNRLLPCNVVRPPSHDPERTILVLGMPSGGTSMVAGSLRLLGVPMGEEYDDANQEDLEFLKLVQSLQPLRNAFGKVPGEKAGLIQELIEKRNARHAVWGWKDPHSRQYIKDILPGLRNPHAVMIFRDNHAAAQRINYRSKIDHLDTISEYLIHMKELVDFVRGGSFPLLLVSYERAVRMGEDFTRQLADFIGAEADEEQIGKVVRYVRPERGGGNVQERFLESDKAYWKARVAEER
jgi:hypothetical protein